MEWDSGLTVDSAFSELRDERREMGGSLKGK